MVYYFESTAVAPPALIYVGKDKVENEDLIKFGWEEDICAHVYLRMQPGDTWSSIPQPLLEDCVQLTKANSIEGNKQDNVKVIYTPWSNLMKNASMATGQVSFCDPKLTNKMLVPSRQNSIINRLNKTKVEKFPDLQNEKDEDLKKKRKIERLAREEKKAQERREKTEYEEKRWQKDHAYDDIMNSDDVAANTNQDRDPDFLDDFM